MSPSGASERTDEKAKWLLELRTYSLEEVEWRMCAEEGRKEGRTTVEPPTDRPFRAGLDLYTRKQP